jgi:uncharacterized RmlC-like cupin family protein
MSEIIYKKKDWGKSAHVGTYNDVMLWQGFVEKGHKCSIHEHKQDTNEIIVVTGKLRVAFFNRRFEPYISTVVEAGTSIKIDPTILHQFEVLEDGVIMEIYWRKPGDRSFDIVRHNEKHDV